MLFALLSVNLFADFMRTGHVTGLLLLASESLVVVLTIVRRRRDARSIGRSAPASMTLVSVAGPPLLRASDGAGLGAGRRDGDRCPRSAWRWSIVGKMALGRSFGIVPANRGVVDRRAVQRSCGIRSTPATCITHVAFLVAHPEAVERRGHRCIADSALVVRALIEERVLSADVAYQAYCRRVGWHLVPGVF